MAEDLSEERRQEIENLFQVLDTDGNGQLSKEEVTTLLRQVGNNPTDEDLEQLFAEVDTDQNGEIDLNEFQAFYIKSFANLDEQKELTEAFKIFDKDNDGFINVEELRTAMTHYGTSLTPEEAKEMLDMADTDKDGKVNYEEFVALMTG